MAGARRVTLTLRPDAAADIPWPPGTSAAWRSLAVSVLHEGLLRPLLGIDDAKLDARTNVDYTADQAEAVGWAREGRYQAAFLIAPTTPDELQAVVRGGEILPQKSTHFYPKLLDGLVFHLARRLRCASSASIWRGDRAAAPRLCAAEAGRVLDSATVRTDAEIDAWIRRLAACRIGTSWWRSTRR